MTDVQVPVTSLQIAAIPGIPLVQPGDDLVALIMAACRQSDIALASGDVLVISSKIVSKSEGRYVDLTTVQPGARAEQVAQETRKDPRIVELVLSESNRISRQARGVLVTEHRLGFVSASSGIDQSNVGHENTVLLLPVDPDGSAKRIRTGLHEQTSAEVGIVISDTHGRPFRLGNVGVAIGVAGMPALLDLRGQPDLFGRELEISQQGYADLVASAAHLVCGEGDEGLPVVLIRGLKLAHKDGIASDLNRPPELDLYR